jgi:hypothetical protein
LKGGPTIEKSLRDCQGTRKHSVADHQQQTMNFIAMCIVERYSEGDSVPRRGAAMTATEMTVLIYEELAEGYAKRQEARQRDLFLILAADAALSLGHRDKAERLRQRLLFFNPHHLVKPFSSLPEALQSPDFKRYVEDLRRQFPPDLAERLWQAQEAQLAELRSEPANGLVAQATESELKVYRLQELATPAVTVPTTPAARVVLPPSPPPPAPSWLASRPSPYEQDVSDAPAPRRKSATPDEATGAWVTSALFLLVLVGSLGLAAYLFIWPFMTP